MNIAEQTAYQILKDLGVREPKAHPGWDRIVDLAQSGINQALELNTRIEIARGQPDG